MQAVARLDIDIMNANKHCILYYRTLLLTSSSNPVTPQAYSVQVISAYCYFSIISFVSPCFCHVSCDIAHIISPTFS